MSVNFIDSYVESAMESLFEKIDGSVRRGDFSEYDAQIYLNKYWPDIGDQYIDWCEASSL